MSLDRVVVLDDGETWGGPEIVLEYDSDKLPDDVLDTMERTSEIDGVIDYIQDQHSNGRNVGRILSINRLVELYNALQAMPPDIVLPPDIWQLIEAVDRT